MQRIVAREVSPLTFVVLCGSVLHDRFTLVFILHLYIYIFIFIKKEKMIRYRACVCVCVCVCVCASVCLYPIEIDILETRWYIARRRCSRKGQQLARGKWILSADL